MTIRCDEEDKRAAAAVAEYYGFDLSSVTRALWKQMARTRRIPLECNSYEPNEESLAAICEAQEFFASKEKGALYASASELLDAAREEEL
jgi:DNA-damage-inducible protein J